MVKLGQILDIELLQKHLANGVVRRQVHPQYPRLYIYNYTEVAQFDRIWDGVTNVCRGLIVEGEENSGPGWGDRVVARPFRKFHNLNSEYAPETMESNLPAETPLVTEKLDGSMGIIYYYDGWRVATRGSFASDQATWATGFLQLVWLDHLCWPPPTLLVTPVVEIIYPANRIVVDYNFADLVLLGLVDIETGNEMSRLALEEFGRREHLSVVKRFDKTLAECAAEDHPNEEGYVLSYPSTGLKVKVKFPEYVRLHRILTGLNPKAIWEMLAEKQGATVDSILQDPKMPAGFLTWFGGWVTTLRNEFARIEGEAKAVFEKKPTGERKEIALYFQRTPRLCSVLFAILDGKDYEPIIWKLLKPRGDAETYKRDGE